MQNAAGEYNCDVCHSRKQTMRVEGLGTSSVDVVGSKHNGPELTFAPGTTRAGDFPSSDRTVSTWPYSCIKQRVRQRKPPGIHAQIEQIRDSGFVIQCPVCGFWGPPQYVCIECRYDPSTHVIVQRKVK